MAKIIISGNKFFNEWNIPEITLCLYNSFDNYLVLAYDAKSYVDVFNQGIPLLGNRKILTIKEYLRKYGSQSCDEDYEKFHCSLLDWGKILNFETAFK